MTNFIVNRCQLSLIFNAPRQQYRTAERTTPKPLTIASFLLWLLCWLVSCQSLQAANQVAVKRLEDKLRIEIDGELFTEYLTSGFAKPLFFPLLGPDSTPMTRNYPMVQGVAGEAEDHPHHKSLWYTHGNVNDVDFWAEGANCGKIVHQRILQQSGGPGLATLTTENQWVDPGGAIVCTDTREYRFHADPDSRSIDMRIAIHASHGDLVFKDTKEGTFGVRTHPNLRLDREGEQFAEMKGHALNSAGDRDHDLWGKRAAWVDYYGKINGQTVGLAIFDHPSNPRHPTWWHARNYGLVAANPFGIHDFEKTPDEPTRGDLKIAAGQSAAFLYRVLLHRGEPVAAGVSAHYEQFAKQNRPSSPKDQTVPADH